MKTDNNLIWKVMVLLCSALLVTACLTDDSDDEGGEAGLTAEQKVFLEAFLQHNWQSDCQPNENGSYTEYTMFFDGSSAESNTISRSGWDYSDDTCSSSIHTHGETILEYSLGEPVSDGEISGYEIDLSVQDGEGKAFQIISEVIIDGNEEYFYMGVDLDESNDPVIELDLSTSENRPTEFETQYKWSKQ